MTPPINSVSDHILQGIAAGDLAASPFEVVSIAKELAARRAANTPVSDDETYEIGKRDGYKEAVQHIDVRTGGDGEYRYCTDHDPDRHTPDAPAMIERIVDRFNALSASPALPSQVVGVSASELAKAYLRGVEWRDENPGHVDYAYRFKAAGDYADKTTSCLTSPAAEPASVCDGQLCYYHGCQGLAECAQGKPHHPAPSASREVTVTDEELMAPFAADLADMDADAVEQAIRNAEDVIDEETPWLDALCAKRRALLAALPGREVE